MSLRSRKQQPSMQRGARSAAPHSGGKYKMEKEDTLTPKLVIAAFVLICTVGFMRESYKKDNPFYDMKSKLTIPLPHRELNPNFKSMLTPEEDIALETHASDHTRYHIVFSTDCSPYQHWQSYLVYFTAMSIKQPGHVTRIASGCEDADAEAMHTWFHDHIQGMSTRFHLHLTPSFSGVKNDAGEPIGDYKFFNKPFGLLHWMEHAEHMDLSQADDVVILIDPDMILLRPLTGDFSQDRDTVISKRRQPHVLGRKVEQGLPFAQTYGFGAQWETLDLERIAGKDTPAKNYDNTDGRLYFPVGPPYLGTVRDMYQVRCNVTLRDMYEYAVNSELLACLHMFALVY